MPPKIHGVTPLLLKPTRSPEVRIEVTVTFGS
jgi:hypothetical protein